MWWTPLIVLDVYSERRVSERINHDDFDRQRLCKSRGYTSASSSTLQGKDSHGVTALSNGHLASNGNAAATAAAAAAAIPGGGFDDSNGEILGGLGATIKRSRTKKKAFRARLLHGERGISLEFGKFVALISISGMSVRPSIPWSLARAD